MALLRSLISFLNFCMSAVVFGITCWAMNTAIDHGSTMGSGSDVWARLSPMYFPMGNAATGFFVFFALSAGVAGMSSEIFGLVKIHCCDGKLDVAAGHVASWAWALTLFAMGFACKEIQLHHNRNAALKTMEAFIIILSATQFSPRMKKKN